MTSRPKTLLIPLRYEWEMIMNSSRYFAVALVACAMVIGSACSDSESGSIPAKTQSAETTIDETHTPSPNSTSVPTQTPGPTSGSEGTSPPTRPPETREGVLYTGNPEYGVWEIGVLSWDEVPSRDEGWKRVYIEALARNLSDSPRWSLDSYRLTVQADDFFFDADGHSIVENLTGASKNPVAPGLAVPIEIVATVPEIHDEYSLNGREGRVPKGIVAQGFDPIMPKEGRVLDLSDTWETPALSIGLSESQSGPLMFGSESKAKQYIPFSVRNNLGDKDIVIPFNFGVSLYLNNGTVLYGDGFHDPGGDHRGGNVAPGMTKKVNFYFGEAQEYDLQGATVVMFHDYVPEQAGVWQLP